MNDDLTLVREYVRNDSEEAFATLVSHHVDLVYSVALRQVRDPHLAEEITQAVFIIFSRKAHSLGDKVILSGWLCRAARYASANALTAQWRRQRREQEAFMQSQTDQLQNDPPHQNEADLETWKRIAPLLDAAMGNMGAKDHDALVLRFFEKKSFAQVGAALGASEEAAKMRVSRALEKLRRFFAKRGINSTATVIGATISGNSVLAAPGALAKAVTVSAAGKGAAASVSTLTLIQGALKTMAWTKAQTVIVAGAAIILAGGTAAVLVHQQRQPTVAPAAVTATQSDFPKAAWHFAGHADPESAFQSTFWAMNQGDVKAYLGTLAPDGSLLKEARGKSEGEITAQNKQVVGALAGYKIIDKKAISDDEVIIVFQPEMAGSKSPGPGRIVVRRIGNEWKVAG